MRRTILRLVGGLYRQERAALMATGGDPLCRVLDTMLDDEQAEVAAAVRPGADTALAEIAEKSGKHPARARELLQELMSLGVVLGYETESGTRYRLPPLSPGLPELLLLSDAAMTADSENAYWLRKAIERRGNALLERAQVYPTGSETPRALARTAKHLAIAPCACARLLRYEQGEGCAHPEEDRCVLLGIAAESAVRAGLARACTSAEAIALLERGTAAGLTQLGTPLDGSGGISRLCAACTCACTVLQAARQTADGARRIRSQFLPEIDTFRCTACGACATRCPTGALTLGLRAAAGDGTAPCLAQCPAHVPVQSILRDAAQGEPARAARTLLAANPLPGVTGAVCDRACEAACVRRFAGGALDIAGAETALATLAPDPEPALTRPERIAVIGSGPAGVSCAARLTEKGFPVTIYEKDDRPGGALTHAIDAARLRPDTAARDIRRALSGGAVLRTGVTFGRDVTLASLRADGYAAVCLAVGAEGTAPLRLDGAEGANVSAARDWLRRVADGDITRVQGSVAVLGGSRAALEAARTAKRLGAEQVWLIARHTKLAPEALAHAATQGVTLCIPAAPVAVTENGLEIEPLERAEADGKTKLRGTGVRALLPAAHILHAAQARVDWSAGAPEGVEQNRNGTLVVSGFTGQTNVPDVFAAGDVVTGTRSVVEAIAAGRAAAESIARYVAGGQSLTLGRETHAVASADEPAQRRLAATLASLPRQDRATPEGLQAEAARCPRCGTIAFDAAKCIGCAGCRAVCSYGVIQMRVTG